MAKKMPGVPLSTLAHHIDIEWLRKAFERTRKDAAAGVDGQTAAEYETNLEANLRTLLDRAKSVERVERIWHRWLGRRSSRRMPWERMKQILQAFPLAKPRIVHSVYLRVANP